MIHSGIILPEAGWALATFIDITQRKQNELLLKESGEQAIYQLQLRHSQEMVILIALDGSRRDVSSAVQQITSWRPEEFLRRPLHNLVHPDDIASIKDVLRSVKKGMLSCAYRGRIPYRDGEYRWVEALFRHPGQNDAPGVGHRSALRRRGVCDPAAHDPLRRSQAAGDRDSGAGPRDGPPPYPQPQGLPDHQHRIACWASGSIADPQKLLERADAALYRSKNSGRDTYNVEYCGGEGEATAPDRT